MGAKQFSPELCCTQACCTQAESARAAGDGPWRLEQSVLVHILAQSQAIPSNTLAASWRLKHFGRNEGISNVLAVRCSSISVARAHSLNTKDKLTTDIADPPTPLSLTKISREPRKCGPCSLLFRFPAPFAFSSFTSLIPRTVKVRASFSCA